MNEQSTMIFIPVDKVEKIKRVCSSRQKNHSAVEYLAEDLVLFINTDFKQRFLDPTLKSTLGFDEFKKRETLFRGYLHYRVSASTLQRAFGKEGVPRKSNPFLEELLDYYIAEYDTSDLQTMIRVEKDTSVNSFAFSEDATIELWKRACGMCSCSFCKRPTQGPVLSNPQLAVTLGKACVIYGIKPEDVRYDPAANFKDNNIENGIWLCLYHAHVINENDGADYPSTKLLLWKKDHEELMHAWMEGKKQIFFAMDQNDVKPESAQKIIDFFNAQKILFDSSNTIEKSTMEKVVNDIRDFIIEQSVEMSFGSNLQKHLYSIENICDVFFDRIKYINKLAECNDLFAALKKVLGIILEEISADYDIALSSNILSIIPNRKD